MAVRSAREVADAWFVAGGPDSRQVEWVAIAMGESSLNDSVVSPAGAIGVWQIMPFNASIGGGTVEDLYDIAYNARVAVLMSSYGTNCAAWDSCYKNIYASGRYKTLAYPEVGSADYNNLAIAAVALGVDAVTAAATEPSLGIGADLAGSMGNIQAVLASGLPALHTSTLSESRVITAMYQPGWKAWMSSGR